MMVGCRPSSLIQTTMSLMRLTITCQVLRCCCCELLVAEGKFRVSTSPVSSQLSRLMAKLGSSSMHILHNAPKQCNWIFQKHSAM